MASSASDCANLVYLDMELNVDNLATVWDAVFDVQAKCYNLGLKLEVPVGILDGIRKQYPDLSDQLREILKEWLKTSTERTWKTLANALKSRIVNEPRLASDIEAEHCQGRPGQASGLVIPRDIQIRVLQQKLQQQQCVIEALKQKLQEQEYTIEARQRQQKLKEQLQLMKQPATQPQPDPPQQETTLRKLIWQDGPKVPEPMTRGSVATDGTTVYCNGWTYTVATDDTKVYFNGHNSSTVHQYHSDTQQWSTLPNLPHIESTLVMADSKLTSVGGSLESGETTDSLFSLMGEGSRRKWSQHFPPMITKRRDTAAICHGHSLIVAGGNDGRNILATVEVLNIDTQLWSIASSLPHPFYWATTSICGERLYLLGGHNQSGGNGTRSVLTCAISKLLHSCQTRTLRQSTIWQHIADAPYKGSSCATLCGQLVAVGGHDIAEDTTAVSAYDESTNSWLAMETMKTPRKWALVASLHDNTMIVIGGISGVRGLDTVEVAKVS